MKSVIYVLILSTLTLTSVFARGPAVEDFVGVDIEQPDLTPAGTHALFNFEQELTEVKADQAPTQAVITKTELKAASAASETSPWSQWLGIVVILALPVVTWSLTMRHLNKRTEEVLPDNVAIFPVKAKEKAPAANDDIKKAS